MQTLKKIYRNNYAGENIVTQLNLQNNEWQPATEFVPNSITNTHTTTQAVAIGNGVSREGFDLAVIANHKGGLFGVNRLQSYGCNALYRNFSPDFLVAVGDPIIAEIAGSSYPTSNIVYTHADSIIKYPGKFYLIPQNIYLDAGAIAAYLAAFDGHSKVYLLGFDQYDMPMSPLNVYTGTAGYPATDATVNGEFIALSLATVVKTYSDVEFIRVMPTAEYWLHPSLRTLPNFRQIDFRAFVLEADIG